MAIACINVVLPEPGFPKTINLGYLTTILTQLQALEIFFLSQIGQNHLL